MKIGIVFFNDFLKWNIWQVHIIVTMNLFKIGLIKKLFKRDGVLICTWAGPLYSITLYRAIEHKSMGVQPMCKWVQHQPGIN